MLGDERSKVDVAWTSRRLAGELRAYIGAHFITAPANRRPEVDGELVGGVAEPRQSLDRRGCYPRGSTLPPRVEESDDAGRVRDEHRDAIGDADGESSSPLRGDVPIRFARAEPPFPAAGVHDNASSVDLTERHDAERRVGELVLDRRPPPHHFGDGIRTPETERSGFAGGGKGANAPALEVGDYLLAHLTHRY